MSPKHAIVQFEKEISHSINDGTNSGTQELSDTNIAANEKVLMGSKVTTGFYRLVFFREYMTEEVVDEYVKLYEVEI